jgi:hypothetical protein
MLDEEEGTTSYKETITRLYQDAKGWVRPDESYDAHALRKMNKFLQVGSFNPLECLVVSAGTAGSNICLTFPGALIEGHNFTRALDLLSTFESKAATAALDNSLSEEYQTIVLFLKGCCYQGLENGEEATKLFDVCLRF